MSGRTISNLILAAFGLLFFAVVIPLVAMRIAEGGLTTRNWIFLAAYAVLLVWVFWPSKEKTFDGDVDD